MIKNNPLFAAGVRGLDRLKWDMLSQQAQAQTQRLIEQGQS